MAYEAPLRAEKRLGGLGKGVTLAEEASQLRFAPSFGGDERGYSDSLGARTRRGGLPRVGDSGDSHWFPGKGDLEQSLSKSRWLGTWKAFPLGVLLRSGEE